jgi:hypothetical protein
VNHKNSLQLKALATAMSENHFSTKTGSSKDDTRQKIKGAGKREQEIGAALNRTLPRHYKASCANYVSVLISVSPIASCQPSDLHTKDTP